jgi:metacaspase-1
LVEGARTGDTVVVQYSGHGSFVPDRDGDEPDGVDECLCPHDIATNGPITDDDLFGILSGAARGARVVVISDSCHSGSVTRFNPIATPASAGGVHAPRRTVRYLAPQAFLAPAQVARLGEDVAPRRPRGARPHAALLMAGCQDAEYSYDAYFEGRPNGAFTFVALRALETLGPGATYADWHARIRAVLPSRQYPQRPDLVGTKAMKDWRVLE